MTLWLSFQCAVSLNVALYQMLYLCLYDHVRVFFVCFQGLSHFEGRKVSFLISKPFPLSYTCVPRYLGFVLSLHQPVRRFYFIIWSGCILPTFYMFHEWFRWRICRENDAVWWLILYLISCNAPSRPVGVLPGPQDLNVSMEEQGHQLPTTAEVLYNVLTTPLYRYIVLTQVSHTDTKGYGLHLGHCFTYTYSTILDGQLHKPSFQVLPCLYFG